MAASWKTLRVFISSTFKDMHAERDHLVRFVFPKLREVLVKHRIHLIDVDLRWGVTSEQDSVAACREVIDECHPRFMGMLGGRYGWVPPESEQSITEDEVHYGVLERDAEMWGNAFFYFRDEEATASIVEKALGDFREPEGSENARKLAELKQSIVNAGLPAFTYGARWDPTQQRLTGLEAFGDHVYAYLLKNIQDDPELDDHFAISTASPVDGSSEEREAMEAFIEDRTEGYIVGSRQALLDKMTAFATASSEQNILVIEGEPGSGKSSLLGKFCQLLAAQRPSLLISHFVGASVGSTDLRRTLRRLCHELAAAVGNSDPLPEDIRELIDLFGKLLSEVAAHQRVVLVIDAINQFDATDGAHDMAWLPLVLPPNVRFIASSLEHPALVALRNRSEPVRIEKLESLSEEDTRSIVAAFLQRYSKRFSGEQIIALLAKPESRLPLYVLTALQELRTLGTYEEITRRIQELPGEAKVLFVWILKQRLSNDPGFRNAAGLLCGSGLVTKFASCLGVSRHGLSQEELIGLIDPGDPLGNVAALLRLLRPYLMHRGELIDFFHNQLREAVQNGFLRNDEQRFEAHKVLATYFLGQAYAVRDGAWIGERPHGLSDLLFHLESARMWDEIIICITDDKIFNLLPPGAYGVDYEKGVFYGSLPSTLTPGSLSALPIQQRSSIGYKIATGFRNAALDRIKQTKSFKRPWPQTERYLRENDPEGFKDYRDTFYEFAFLARNAAQFAIAAFEASPESRQTLRDFFDSNGGMSSFLEYLGNFGNGETGLSHALEDYAGEGDDAWKKLFRMCEM
jgi:hypothetical protein